MFWWSWWFRSACFYQPFLAIFGEQSSLFIIFGLQTDKTHRLSPSIHCPMPLMLLLKIKKNHNRKEMVVVAKKIINIFKWDKDVL